MIWLIDNGDAYHQSVTFVVEGDDSPADVIAAYRKQLDDHCKEARQLMAKAAPIIGKQPKRPSAGSSSRGNYFANYKNWQARLNAYLDKTQKIPAPVLEDFLADAGYRLLDHSMVRVS